MSYYVRMAERAWDDANPEPQEPRRREPGIWQSTECSGPPGFDGWLATRCVTSFCVPRTTLFGDSDRQCPSAKIRVDEVWKYRLPFPSGAS